MKNRPQNYDWEDDFDNENASFEECPKCGRSYDDADFDFQICHFCKWDSEKEKYVKIKKL